MTTSALLTDLRRPADRQAEIDAESAKLLKMDPEQAARICARAKRLAVMLRLADWRLALKRARLAHEAGKHS